MFVDDLAITFFVYSVLGYISEVIYCSVGQRRLVNRGFLYGPWLPIYGFGGVVIKLCLEPLSNIYIWGPVMVFVFGMILTSIIEYIGSWMLEKAFSIKLWDYSRKFCNINGRVCLLNSTLFGVGGLAITYLINPKMEELIASIPAVWHSAVAEVIVIGMSIDFVLSCVKMTAVKNALREAREKGKELEERYKALVEQGKLELANEYGSKLVEDLRKSKDIALNKTKSLIKHFPTCTSRNLEIREQLDNVRAWRNNAKEYLTRVKAELESKKQNLESKLNG